MTLFDQPRAADQPAGFGRPAEVVADSVAPPPPVKRPRRFALSNWPVRRKVVAIALVPLLLAAAFGGVRIYTSTIEARDLSVAAKRADLVPDVTAYMAALENALVTNAAAGDVAQAVQQYDASRSALAQRLDDTDVISDVRLAVTTLLNYGKDLLDKATSNAIGLRQQVTTYAPLLLTSETAITGSVRVDDETVRSEAEGLSRAVGARGQMAMQRMLVERGGDMPEPELRSSMIALAGTEPSTVMGMATLLGGASDQAAALRSEMVQRLSLMSDPSQPLVDNPQFLQSIQTTDQIAQQLVNNTTTAITTAVHDEATQQRNNAIRDAIVVLAAFLIVLGIVFLVARSLTRPLRRLRDGALKIAHEDLGRGIERVKAGDEREPDPLPIHTTEEVGQVAHAVDELHAQALLLAGDEARLRVMVDDMFETMSRRNKSLVDQQLSLIDRLERNENDPDRLDSLFRLDHLASRMRRNGANLLVLAGAQVSREHAGPVALASLINAAASEVEDYQRVETGMVPDCSLAGAVAGDAVHLLAELIDNALRYSPPTEQVRVTAVYGADGGVMVDVDDAGLGMTDADLRIANMRLNAGGEVSSDNARHMGLFVVGRLARQHGISVRLLTPVSGRGTTAQVHIPITLLEAAQDVAPELHEVEAEVEAAPSTGDLVAAASLFGGAPVHEEPERAKAAQLNGSGPTDASVTLLPRRSPGSSGITGDSGDRPFDETDGVADGAEPEAWWSPTDTPPEDAASEEAPVDTAEAPSNTSGFFASRRLARQLAAAQAEPVIEPRTPEPVADEAVVSQELEDDTVEPEEHVEHVEEAVAQEPEPAAPEPEPDVPAAEATQQAPEATIDTGSLDLSDMNKLADELSPQRTSSGVDLIYQRMISEWLVDPHELAVPQDWKSVWDNGWAAAAEAESRPVEAHTDHGLPVREPGARLIPGGTAGSAEAGAGQGLRKKEFGGENAVTSNGGQNSDADAQEVDERKALERDPDAIRTSISNHFGGVHAARSHARNTTQGLDHE